MSGGFTIDNLKSYLPWLDDHQVRGINWITSRSCSYLAHAPGAGKTCQAIVASLLIPLSGTTLFIVPPSLTLNWQREVVRFSNLMGITSTVSIVSFPWKTHHFQSDFLICPDSLIAKDWVYKELSKIKKKLIAVDEASRFKEPTTQRSIAFYGGKIKDKLFPGLNAPYTVFLDGSPMPNRPIELWAPAYALAPQSIGQMTYTEFGMRYCNGHLTDRGEWDFRGSSNESELKSRLQKDFMHVVKESELNHPERMRSLIFMSEDVRSKQMMAWEKKNLKKLNLKDISEKMNLGDIAEHRFELGLRKSRWVAKYAEEKLDKNESVLLFAWHREVCEELSDWLKFYKPFVIYGRVSGDKREEAFKDFNAGRRKVLIGNIQSLGRGHNLQRASRVIFAEYSWTDELNKQCEKRASRRGSNFAGVRCDYLIAPNSIDEVVAMALFTKEKRVRDVIG